MTKKATRRPDHGTTILLVRHGQTATTGTSLPGRAPGLHLADEGVRQAERAAERIAELKRSTPSTAHPSSGHARPPHRSPRHVAFDPRRQGLARVRFRRVDRRRAEEPDEAARVGHRAAVAVDVPVPGRRELRQMQHRMITTLDALRAEHRGGTIVCVSHADPIKAAIAHAMGPISTCSNASSCRRVRSV